MSPIFANKLWNKHVDKDGGYLEFKKRNATFGVFFKGIWQHMSFSCLQEHYWNFLQQRKLAMEAIQKAYISPCQGSLYIVKIVPKKLTTLDSNFKV